ncbi:MAG: hypothetical protein JEZ06_17065 [Anaerolineaceae bacterium]|nr:hypothetical protein [Anaerolineaceae bacterium]
MLTPRYAGSGVVGCQVEDGEKLRDLFIREHVVARIFENEIRFSPHFFNSLDEIDQVLDLMNNS